MRELGLVFLCIIHLRFPWRHSIADVIRKRHGHKTLKTVTKFEKLGYQVKKCQLDIEFLNTCQKYNVIPNFLRFPVTNKTLKDSLSYLRCKQSLLIKVLTLVFHLRKLSIQNFYFRLNYYSVT